MAKTSSLVLGAEPKVYVYAVLLVLFGYYVFSSVRAYWRLRHFKGPLLASWSDLWWIRATTSCKGHLYLSDVSTKYGRLARTGPNTLLTCDEELFRRINSPRSGYHKGDFYKAFRFGANLDNVFSETDNDRHLYLRKRLMAGYTGRDNPELEARVDAEIFSLIKSWKERYMSNSKSTKPMDLARQIQYLTLDIITSLYFGEPFGWVSTDSDLYEYITTMDANFPIINFVSAVPLLSRIMNTLWVQRLLSPSVKDRVGMGKVKAVSNKIIDRRLSGLQDERPENVNMDMMTSFSSHGLTKSEIADGALIAILAGSDTSATIIRSGLLTILTQPRVLQALQAESINAGISSNQIISYSRALELPYLQACVKEVLRHHPTSTGPLPRIVPPRGDYFEGKFIPGGTIITQCGWNLHRLNFSAYGHDADIFRPERWIEATEEAKAGKPERLDRMERAHELVFSVGDFKCLGYRIALIEISKVLFELVRRFDIGLINAMQPMESNLNYGLFLQHGMWVRLEEK